MDINKFYTHKKQFLDFLKSFLPKEYKKQTFINKNENNKNDFAFVESFFKKPKIKAGIEEIENNIINYKKYRDFILKKTFKLLIPIVIPIFILTVLGLYHFSIAPNEFIFFMFFVIVYLVFLKCKKNIETKYPEETKSRDTFNKNIKEKNIEGFIMPLFASYIKDGLEFDSYEKFFKEDNDELIKKGLIEKYDRKKERKNSIALDYKHKNQNLVRNITLNGIRVITEESYRKDNKTKYRVNNDCYINKIEFKDSKYFIGKEIKIVNDFHNKSKFLSKIGFKNKNRVVLENQDFEEKFDVYCEDEILARQILNPDFMYKLYDFVKKFQFKRIFEFYFHKNYLYIKYDIFNSIGKGDLGEVDIYKLKDISYYVNFYIEIKNILSLIDDLKLFYYDKGRTGK